MANGTFQRVHIEPEVENEMESQGNSEKKIPLVQRSLRARLKNKRKDKNYSKMDTQELPNRCVQISMFESAEFLTAKMEKMKAEMDKYLKHKIAPEKTKKEKKKNDEIVMAKHTIQEDRVNEEDERRRKIREMARNGQLKKLIDQRKQERKQKSQLEIVKEKKNEKEQKFEKIMETKKDKETDKLKNKEIHNKNEVIKNGETEKKKEQEINNKNEMMKNDEIEKEREIQRKKQEEVKKDKKPKSTELKKLRSKFFDEEEKKKKTLEKNVKDKLERLKKEKEDLLQKQKEKEAEMKAKFEEELRIKLAKEKEKMKNEFEKKQKEEKEKMEQKKREEEMRNQMRETQEKMRLIQLENEKLKLENEKNEIKYKLEVYKKSQRELEIVKKNEEKVKTDIVFQEIEKFISDKAHENNVEQVKNEFMPNPDEVIEGIESEKEVSKEAVQEPMKLVSKGWPRGLDYVENENKQIFKRVDKALQLKQRREIEARGRSKHKKKAYDEEIQRLRKLYSKFDYDNEQRKKERSAKKQQWNENKMQKKFLNHFSSKQETNNKFMILKPGLIAHNHHPHHCDLEKKFVSKKAQLKQKAISAWSKNQKPNKDEEAKSTQKSLRSMQQVDDPNANLEIRITNIENNLNTQSEKQVEAIVQRIPEDSKSVQNQERPKSNYNSQSRRNSERKNRSTKPKRVIKTPQRVIVIKNPMDWRYDRSKSKKNIKSLKEPKIGGIYGIDHKDLNSTRERKSLKKNDRNGFDPKNLQTNLQSKSSLHFFDPRHETTRVEEVQGKGPEHEKQVSESKFTEPFSEQKQTLGQKQPSIPRPRSAI